MGAIHLEGLLPGPRSLPGLVAVGSSETEPGFWTVGWAAGLLASSHALPHRARRPFSSHPPPPPRPGREVATLLPASQKQLGGHQAHRGQLHGSCFAWTFPRPPAQASALIMSPLCLTARAGPTGIPDHSGELSDTEALSSPSLGPKPSHQQVFHHPNPRAQSLMPMVTRQQSPGE